LLRPDSATSSPRRDGRACSLPDEAWGAKDGANCPRVFPLPATTTSQRDPLLGDRVRWDVPAIGPCPCGFNW